MNKIWINFIDYFKITIFKLNLNINDANKGKNINFYSININKKLNDRREMNYKVEIKR